MSRTLVALFLLPGLVLFVSASGAGAATDEPESIDPPPLERALAVIRPARIRADLHFLASDALEGRDSPGPGLQMAARFLQLRVARLGFRPAGDDEGFVDRYEVERAHADLARTGARLLRGEASTTLTFGEELYFYPGGELDLETEAEVVYVGRGSRGEVKGLDLSGKWALARISREVVWRERRENVAGGGAVGLLNLSDPALDDGDFARNARRFSTPPPADAFTRYFLTGPRFPTTYLGPDLVGALLPGGLDTAPGPLPDVRWREIRVVAKRETHELENVVALWPGNDPQLREEAIVLCAHYDSIGARGDEIWNGADDNGSGTAALLALADALREYGPMRRSVILLWPSGEEKGLLGSAAWVRDPANFHGLRPVLVINLDTIGRCGSEYLAVTPTVQLPEHNALVRLARKLAPQEGFPTLASADEYWPHSDHISFHRHLGVPAILLFGGMHEDMHQPTDTADRIDYDKVARVSRLVMRMLDVLQGVEAGD